MSENPAEIDWRTVTRRIGKGDAASFEVYYDHLFEMMFREAQRSGLDHATCFDLVHDSMLKVMKSIRPMATFEDVTRWTRRVVQSVTLDYLRKVAREAKRDEAFWQQVDEAISPYVEHSARILWIQEQIELEADDVAKMLSLRFQFGWTLRKIGEQFGMKPGAVDGRIQRALQRLRLAAKEAKIDE